MQFERLYWNNRYVNGRNSGYGSYGEQLQQKLAWLSALDVKSIVDIGCGDFNLGQHLLELYPDAKYQGFDVADAIVERNSQAYPQHEFSTMPEVYPSGDLLLCIDVLFHIIKEEDAERMMANLYKSWTKYLAITAYERDENLEEHVRIRKFDYKRFGEPIIRKVVEEDGEMYFYLFKK